MVGTEKESAVSLGVSIPGGIGRPGTRHRGIIALMTPPTRLALPDGRSLDVYEAGPPAGDALVFHHGTPGAGLPFDLHVAALADRGLRFVGWSRPGYGSSSRRPGRSVAADADDAQAVLDHLGIERAYVLGWSGGGPHALAATALLPDRVRATALIGGIAPWEADGLSWLDGMGDENIQEFGAALKGEEALRAFLEPFAPAFREVTPEGVAAAFGDLVDDVDRGSISGGFAAWLANGDHEALRESIDGWLDDDLAFARGWGFELDEVRRPVHVWQGAHDRMVPFAHGQWLVRHLPTARPHLLDGHGHLSLVVDSIGWILDELVASGS